MEGPILITVWEIKCILRMSRVFLSVVRLGWDGMPWKKDHLRHELVIGWGHRIGLNLRRV